MACLAECKPVILFVWIFLALKSHLTAKQFLTQNSMGTFDG
jgi:hypothetical protein